MTEIVKGYSLCLNSAAIADTVGIHPVFINVSIKDFTPFSRTRKTDPVAKTIERRKVYYDKDVMPFALNPAMEDEHAVLVVYMDDAEALTTQSRIAPTKSDQLPREAHMIDHLFIAGVQPSPME